MPSSELDVAFHATRTRGSTFRLAFEPIAESVQSTGIIVNACSLLEVSYITEHSAKADGTGGPDSSELLLRNWTRALRLCSKQLMNAVRSGIASNPEESVPHCRFSFDRHDVSAYRPTSLVYKAIADRGYVSDFSNDISRQMLLDARELILQARATST